MKAVRHPRPVGRAASAEIGELRARLAEAEDAFRAIRSGEVDAVVVEGRRGPHVFTLQGAEHAYRTLIESMNEGALTLTADKTILFANQCFARMVKCPLEQVVGSSIRRFLSESDRVALRPLVRRPQKSGSKIQVVLMAQDGSQLPVQISVRRLPRIGSDPAVIGMVATDMTEARHTEQMLRALSQRLVQTQENERGRVALELHDHITQLLCAVIFRSQALAEKISARNGPLKTEATRLRELLATTTEEVERISRSLRPSVLNHLGMDAVLRETGAEFARRTGIAVKATCGRLSGRLPAEVEVALLRILQQALHNVEIHAHAGHVSIRLARNGRYARLTIKDDGCGFTSARARASDSGVRGIGLFGMNERAASVGGTMQVKSDRRNGTTIVVRIPLPGRRTG